MKEDGFVEIQIHLNIPSEYFSFSRQFKLEEQAFTLTKNIESDCRGKKDSSRKLIAGSGGWLYQNHFARKSVIQSRME